MPIADYAHWNEEAEYMWWHEEGKHPDEPDYDFEEDIREAGYYDSFCEEVYEMSDEELVALCRDREYFAKWPKAIPIIREAMCDRGLLDTKECA